jgi:hypothetical protein
MRQPIGDATGTQPTVMQVVVLKTDGTLGTLKTLFCRHILLVLLAMAPAANTAATLGSDQIINLGEECRIRGESACAPTIRHSMLLDGADKGRAQLLTSLCV